MSNLKNNLKPQFDILESKVVLHQHELPITHAEQLSWNDATSIVESSSGKWNSTTSTFESNSGNFVTLDTDQVITGSKTIDGYVRVNGVFEATSAVIITTEHLALSANFVELNSNATPALSGEDAGLKVHRGGANPNAELRWNGTTQKWTGGLVGSLKDIAYTDIVNTSVIGPSASTDGFIPLFDGVNGKKIKNSVYSPSSFATSAQGSAADSAYAAAITNAHSDNTVSTLVKRDGSGNFSAGTVTANLTGTSSKATNLVGGNGTTLLGSMPYQSNTDTTLMVSPNVSTTKKFLRMTGDGTNGAAPAWDTIVAGDVPVLNQDTTGSATYLKASATTGKISLTGPTIGTTWAKTVRDAADTLLELGGSYTPSGTWNWTSATVTWPTFNQSTSGNAATAGKSTNLVGGNGTTLFGSVPYQSGTDTTSMVSPNVTTTKKFLRMTGDGSNGTVPAWDTIVAGDVPTLNQSTSGSAGSLKSPSTTGLMTVAGMTAGNTRAKTVRDADDTILELGGSYTPTGTWVWTSASVTWPTFNQNTSGTAAKATNLVGGVLGSIHYQSAVDTSAILAPNTTLTRQVLTMTGDGAGHGAIPAWYTLGYADVGAASAAQGSNADSAYAAAVTNATASATINTLVKRDSSGDTTLNSLKLSTDPTLGSFTEGQLFYDKNWKTLAVSISSDVTLQIGQETFIRVYNATGSPIPNGTPVYITGTHTGTGGNPDAATVAPARSDNISTAIVLGLMTQATVDGAYGLCTVRGHINDIKTDYATWTAGQKVYLSDVVAGEMTNVLPSDPALHVSLGTIITVHPTAGRILVSSSSLPRLQDLSDVTNSAPTDGNTLVREGSTWAFRPGQVSAGAGVNCYLDNTAAADDYMSLVTVPVTATSTQTANATIPAGSTVFIKGFMYNQAENRTKWDGGVWKFDTYAYVSAGAGVTTVLPTVYNVQYPGGTATVTGSGTSRTFTLSGYTGTPFVAGDANADITLAGYVQTAGGTFQITGYTALNIVTIATTVGYVNESAVSYSIHKYKFKTETPEINQTVTPIVFETSIIQPDIALLALTDTLAVRYYGRTTSTSSKIVYITFNGSDSPSYFSTPLSTRHNDLAGLNMGEYMHVSTGIQTFAGVKTFSSFPVGPSSAPISNYELVNKKYVDDTVLAENLFDRSGTVLTTHTAGDSLALNTSTVGTVNKLTVNANVTADNASVTQINTGATGNKGLVIQRYSAGQTANLLEWQDSAGGVLSCVNSLGYFGAGTSSPTMTLDVGSNSAGGHARVAATLSTEMAPALEAVNWNLGTGWTAGGGVLSKVAGTSSSATPSGTFTVTPGRTYKVVVVVSASVIGSNYLTCTVGGVATARLDPGTITSFITAANSNPLSFNDVTINESITITSVSVKELTPSTGDLTVEGSLNVDSMTTFMNPVGMGFTATQTVPLLLMTNYSSDALRIIRTNFPAQYIAINEGDGSKHQIQAFGEKPFTFSTNATNLGYEWYTNTNILSMALGARGSFALTPQATDSVSPLSGISFTSAAHTNMTASSEFNSIYLNGAVTQQFATGALATQRFMRIAAPTYAFVGDSTITKAATVAISGAPVAGTHATITNSYALWVQAGTAQFDAGVNIPTGQTYKINNVALAYGDVGAASASQGSNADSAYAAAVTNATDTNSANYIVKRNGSGNFSAGTITANLTGTASKATNLVGGNGTTLLGSLPYQSGTDATSMLNPNVSATKMFLSQTGTGVNGAVPSWTTLTSTDVGLSAVENTALSTWAGTSNITTVGTLTGGLNISNGQTYKINGTALKGSDIGAVNKTGFENRTDSTLGMSGSNFQITTGSSYNIWAGGVKFNINTTRSVAITNDNALNYVYFDTTGTLQMSGSPWSIVSDNVPVAIVHKAGTSYIIGDERHHMDRNRPLHEWAHDTIGARWQSGGQGTFTATTMSIAAVAIHDEDIDYTVATPQTTCWVMYRTVAGTSMTFMATPSVVPYNSAAGIPQYDNAGVPSNISNNQWGVYWVYATTYTSPSIVSVLSWQNYSSLSSAQTSSAPTLPLTTAEWKLLYRVIYQRNGGSATFVQADDYRIVSTGPANGTGGSSATAVNVTTNTTAFTRILSASDTTVQAALNTLAANVGGREEGMRLVFDGQGFALTAGTYIDLPARFAATITGWTILNTNRVGASDAISIDVRKDTLANYIAGTLPTTSIVASEPIAFTGGAYGATGTGVGWTTSIAATDVVRFYISSATNTTNVTVLLNLTRA